MAENAPQTRSQPMAIPPIATKMNAPVQPRIDTFKAKAQLTVMSPVNQNGSFEFDRVIKAGMVVKRTRKTKQWKPTYLVLRPNLLSMYRDKDETKLRHQINLSDVTAIARQKDSKKKMEHVFGLFSPARNFRFGALSEKDAQEWVDLIRTEARIDAEDEDMIFASPTATKPPFGSLGRRDITGSSSSEVEPRPISSVYPERMRGARRPSHTLNYSGNEYGSISDFSDTGFLPSSTSINQTSHAHAIPSQLSNTGATPDDERVIYHGWLFVLKSKGGVRQWKKVWVVLRPKALGLYKNEEEYSANLIVPFSNIIDAVEIDPVSRTKRHCMQIISEEKNVRFCANNDDQLARWLGAFKSLLAKRKEVGAQRVLATGANNPGVVLPSAAAKAGATGPLKSLVAAAASSVQLRS